jgi:hypothetical protein
MQITNKSRSSCYEGSHKDIIPYDFYPIRGSWSVYEVQMSVLETIFFKHSPKWWVDWNKYSPKWNRARHVWRVTFFYTRQQIPNFFLTKLMTCQNLQNKLLNITVLFIWYLLASIKKCHSPNMASSINFMFLLRFSLRIRLKYFKTKLFYLH